MAREPENEACCRMRVDTILIECIGLEQDRARMDEAHALAPISLTAETALQLEVKLKGQKRLLNGRADYSLMMITPWDQPDHRQGKKGKVLIRRVSPNVWGTWVGFPFTILFSWV